MSIFFLMPGAMIVNPAIQGIAEAYPQVPYPMVLLLSTIPMLIVVPTSLVSGAIAGRRIRYKSLLLASTLLYIVGGAMPFFLGDFFLILLSRTIYGIGAGLLTPLANSLVLRLFEGEAKARMTGLGSMVINISSALFMLLGGFVSALNVHWMWLIHLIAIIPSIVIMLYLPEPAREPHEERKSQSLPPAVFLFALFIGFIFMNVNVLLLNMSTIIITENMGSADRAGMILSMYTVGGILSGAAFGKVYAALRRFAVPVSVLSVTTGLGFCYLAHDSLAMTIGCFITGLGFFILFPTIMLEAGRKSAVAASASVSALVLSSINLGGFLSSFYIGCMGLFTKAISPRLPLILGAAVTFMAAVMWMAKAGLGSSRVGKS